MAIKSIKSKPKRKIEIDLTGSDGNAFALLAYARDFCRELERDFAPIREEMMAGDYENLLTVFDREFGDFVTLYR